MMLVWSIPVGVLLGSALLIVLINRGHPNIGVSWLAAILAALVVWGWTVSLYWQTDLRTEEVTGQIAPLSADLSSDPEETSSSVLTPASPGFVLDRVSYPYMLAVSALLVVLLLTAPSYMEPQTAPRLWFFYLLIETIGYLSVSAKDLTFVIYGWVIFDGIDLLTRYLQGRISRGYVTAIAVRFVGTILAASSLAYSSADPGLSGGMFISERAGIFLMLACGLRMGILPITQPYAELSSSRVGLGTMLRLVSVLTVMPVLSRIPMGTVDPNLAVILSMVGGFASLVGAVGWLLSENAFTGNTYFAMAICGMAFVSSLHGNQASLTVWGVSLALTCASLSLYQIHNVLMNVLASLLIICFSGMPFTPNAIGWNGLVSPPYSLKDLLFIIVMLLVTAGAFTHVLRTAEKKFSDLEPWMRSVYPLGFLAAVGTHCFIGMFCFDEMFSLGVLQASVPAFAGGLMLAAFLHWMPERIRTQNMLAWTREGVSLFWRLMQRLLDMNWLIGFGSAVMRSVSRAVSAVTMILENNGGLVWEFLLLAFLVAAAFAGGFN
ncbi:MAG: hypothetical protein IJI07_02455 [Flexilinea sp.]|nr:hypothetical protein [Flexilinea sp.]